MELNDLLKDVHGVVEANSFEALCLWQNAKDSGHSWVSAPSGLGKKVGEFYGKPVFISLLSSEVRGKKILFVDATSQVVDHEMIEIWLQTNLPKSAMKSDGKFRKTDAMNFHNLF